ncbi:MAG TPA: RnfABCDGE type electron transport complex subunit D [Candidatus Pullilachnospira stercoravium]|uniref:Ion-translocating oxidoreductase complex subunit D n=1 Tax=Candidatus Pullilachnospira stercoravium TaxID=2840913 RepID=A0A9D1NS96_9FIRM|nr:RnfABCDGE type electron transport complex subunit D [Candidatus Pullilachnospira stercoravium]
MSEMLHVSSSPHIRSRTETPNLMAMVIVALLPATLSGIWNFGVRALCLILISIAACVATEGIYERLMHKESTLKDLSAVVTGLLLGLNLPPAAPWWIPVIGGFFAILVVKQLFGGLGQNFMNPALAARCFLLLAFTGPMTDFSPTSGFGTLADTVSGATPLAALRAGESVDLLSMFLGNTTGTIGETSALALLLGGIFLVLMGVIDLRIPLTYLGSFLVFMLLFGGHGADGSYLLGQLFGGGLMLGAWFMATDYVTSPITPTGRVVYGVILGIMTGIFRVFGSSAEGVSYAIIFSNLLIPLIERLTIPAAFGKGGRAHEQ